VPWIGRAGKTDPALVATAYFFRSAQITAATARIFQAEEADRYETLRDEIAEAFDRRYVTPSGLMVSDAPPRTRSPSASDS
jgi:alpha-L-rhamnosidase